MISYRVEFPCEETACESCGLPLEIGMLAFRDRGRVYCGITCAADDSEAGNEQAAYSEAFADLAEAEGVFE